MIWAVLLVTAMILLAAMLYWGKMPRAGLEITAAALCLGIAGYAFQSHPGMAGAPKEPTDRIIGQDEQQELLSQRQQMGDQFSGGQGWMVLADGMTRQGRFASAATVLRSGLRENPQDPDLWVALGNALVGHSGGIITPAAQFAFQKAADIQPEHPGPPFFMGLSLAQSGRLEEARVLWAELLERSPKDAPWRGDLESRLKQIDAMLGAKADVTSTPEKAPQNP